MQLRRLIECSLMLKTREKQPNGTYLETGSTLIDNYKIEKEELIDQVSATVYGANVKNGLEMLLLQAFASWEFWHEK